MKKLFIVLLVALAFTLASCSNEVRDVINGNVVALDYALEYLGDGEFILEDVGVVSDIYINGVATPITKDNLYGMYYTLTFITDLDRLKREVVVFVEVWYENAIPSDLNSKDLVYEYKVSII